MKSGDCDTCGKWDSNLILGMCCECMKFYNLSADEMRALQKELDDERKQTNDPLLQS